MDPDCAGITPAIPWDLNHAWLHLISTSGAALFVSPDPAAIGNPQREAIKQAFHLAALGNVTSVPENWFRDSTPESWTIPQKGSPARSWRYRRSGVTGGPTFAV
jgi:alpha-galactosidase